MEKDKRKLPKNFKLPDWLSVKQKFEIYIEQSLKVFL